MHSLLGILDPFEVIFDLNQEDVLSPTLFDLTLGKIVNDTNDERSMEINNEQVIIAYTDVIVIMGVTKEEVINLTSKLIHDASTEMGLLINKGKIKCIYVSREPPNIDSIPIIHLKKLMVRRRY